MGVRGLVPGDDHCEGLGLAVTSSAYASPETGYRACVLCTFGACRAGLLLCVHPVLASTGAVPAALARQPGAACGPNAQHMFWVSNGQLVCA
jgi:hypothetical protein